MHSHEPMPAASPLNDRKPFFHHPQARSVDLSGGMTGTASLAMGKAGYLLHAISRRWHQMPAGQQRREKRETPQGLRLLVAYLLLGALAACAASPSTNSSPPAVTAPANIQPVYPIESRRAGEQGASTLKVLVSQQGEPEQIELKQSSGYARLDNAAIDAVRKWQFIPAKRDDQAIATWVIVPIRFQLEESLPDKPGSSTAQLDLAQTAREMARLEAEISKEIADHGNIPAGNSSAHVPRNTALQNISRNGDRKWKRLARPIIPRRPAANFTARWSSPSP